MSLTDLVKLQNLTEASAVFLVVSGERSGILHFAQGQLFHAETDDQRGDAAALEILAWTGGEFIRSERPLASSASVNSSLHVLIASALGVTGMTGTRSATTSTGIRRRGESRLPDTSPADPGERSPASSQRDLRAAATPGIAAALAPRRSSKLPEGRAVASVLVSPLGDLTESQGPAAEALATRVAYVSRLCDLIGQAMGSGETRALRARYTDCELALHPHGDGNLFGCMIAPQASASAQT